MLLYQFRHKLIYTLLYIPKYLQDFFFPFLKVYNNNLLNCVVQATSFTQVEFREFGIESISPFLMPGFQLKFVLFGRIPLVQWVNDLEFSTKRLSLVYWRQSFYLRRENSFCFSRNNWLESTKERHEIFLKKMFIFIK